MSDLMHLAYISKSTLDHDLPVVETQVANILGVAQRNNVEMDVTGALLYSGGYFCQVLEGRQEHVTELFERIQMDDRHTDVTVLHFEPLEKRGFREWAMAFAGIEDTRRFDLEGIKESKDELLMHEAGENVVNTLAELVGQHQAIIDGKP